MNWHGDGLHLVCLQFGSGGDSCGGFFGYLLALKFSRVVLITSHHHSKAAGFGSTPPHGTTNINRPIRHLF